MLSSLIASAVSLCVLTGGIAGLLLSRVLPEHHLSKETTDTVRLGAGMLSVLAALVLGLLVATARDSLDAADRLVRGLSADLIETDQALGAYGAETAPIRDLLRRYAAAMLRDGWAQSARDLLDEGQPAGAALQQVRRAVLALEPPDAARAWLRDQALAGSGALLKARWELLERQDLPIRPAFLVVLTLWIACIFVSFGLGAPCNATVVVTFAVCAAAIGASVFLVLEMEAPFDGLIQAARHPVEVALARIGQ
ncbi:hypothetical protein JMJ55_27410 [Belnapia sp. T6]|uniref:DUF4239 domain-containing protein n=1 Tax=Belnapia mucosa TaxID=2804532 RepID=A0ABS1VBJ7_9PROT|nr:hypothetical protein [Belnapia mucosa]MBL6459061.1 hypothetical protein [Belnapia mucosa]